MNLRDKLKAIEKPKVKVTVQPTAPEVRPAFTDCWRTETTHAPSAYPIRRETKGLARQYAKCSSLSGSEQIIVPLSM